MTAERVRLQVRYILVVALIVVLISGSVFGQSTPRPTSPSGSNNVSYNASTGEYAFRFDDRTLYWYRDKNSQPFDGTGGTLAAIRASTYDGLTTFHPSWTGGITVEFPDYGEKRPTDAGVTFSRLRPTVFDGTTVTSQWKMKFATRSFDYQLQIQISGRTLILRVEALNDSRLATAFDFDRCEHASNPSIVKVPYLTLFNLLASNNSFTSLFFDWEMTNCSGYSPGHTVLETVRGSPTSARFGPVVRYNKKTNGVRNPLKETMYITVSPDLEGALPNLPGPVAPLRSRAASQIVLNFGPPYWWAITNMHSLCRDNPDNYSLLDTLKKLGVQNVSVIMSLWQKRGMQSSLPEVLPANTFKMDGRPLCGVPDCLPPTTGGNELLIGVRKHVASTLQYGFALYENYVDYYDNAVNHRVNYRAKMSEGNFIAGYRGSPCGVPRVLKPGVVLAEAELWSGSIKSTIGPTWSYLDVHSAINPSDRVDYDSTYDGAGKFLATLRAYRGLPGVLRKYGGPVQGEGGHHFLYAGYFDDFEARIQTADNSVYGERAPLLVDFDILKIRPKSALHGAGHYTNFYSNNVHAEKKFVMSREQMLVYIATELAYGHAGLITKRVFGDSPVTQALIESRHVFPVYASILNARPISIQYGEGQSALEYIRDHPSYWDYRSPDFMNRVRVTYDNGTVVCVNRSPQPWSVRNVGMAGGWFTRNEAGQSDPVVGRSGTTSFTLKANSGWVCYVP